MAGAIAGRLHGARGQLAVALIAVSALGALILVVRAAMAHWAPATSQYPVQGVYVNAADGPIDWAALATTGARFAYLDVIDADGSRDPDYEDNLARARAAGLRTGAVLDYDLCRPEMDQGNLFVTTVARDPDMLPPVVRLAYHARCTVRPAPPLVLSDLSVLLTQIERQAGKSVILMPSSAFERDYAVSARIARPLWLVRNFVPPSYGAKPWVMWTANAARHVMGAPHPVAWAVVRP